jgi:hypothetical protein
VVVDRHAYCKEAHRALAVDSPEIVGCFMKS